MAPSLHERIRPYSCASISQPRIPVRGCSRLMPEANSALRHLERQFRATDHAGFVAKLRQNHAQVVMENVAGARVDRPADWQEEQLTGLGHAATDDDGIRILSLIHISEPTRLLS